jgi:hypothetical protein
MKQQVFPLLVVSASVAGAVTAAVPSGSPAAREKRPPLAAVFRDDDRLQPKVTLAVNREPLGELLGRLSQEVHVPLTASSGTADDRVTLFVDARPAAEVLSRFAQHLHFRWFRASRGYELRQDGAESAREAALGQVELDEEWAELRAWAARLYRLAATPRARLEQQAKEIDRLLADSRVAPDEQARLTTEAEAIRDVLRPETVPAIAILRSLTPVQVERLRRDGNLLLSADDGSLSPRVLPLVRNAEAGKDVAFVDTEAHPVWADAQVSFVEGWYGGGPPRPGERRTSLMVKFILRREEQGKQQWGGVEWSPHLRAKQQAVAAPSEPEDPALLRPVELTLSMPRRGGSAAGKGDSPSAESRRFWPGWPTLGDAAQALHQATGLEVLSDSFVRTRVDPKWVAGRQPVVRILNTLARELNVEWQKEGNLLLLRSRTYYRDRELEVPERILRPWQEHAVRVGVMPLDALAELSASLNDRQTLGMSMYWGWYLEEPWVVEPGSNPFYFYQWRRHLRFWASLNPTQRQAAQAGGILPSEQMGTAQRAAFATALTDPNASLEDPEAAFLLSRRSLTPVEVLSGGFSARRADWRLQRFVGEKPGKETEIVARYPADRPPILSKLPQEFRWSPVGPPGGLNAYSFAYHLGGESKPARTVDIEVIRPRVEP